MTLIASDFSLSLNVALAFERYLAICHPLYSARNPVFKKSLLYILSAMMFSSIKDIHLYTSIVCHYSGITYDPEVRGYTILFIFSVFLTFVAVVVLTVLCALTICKLKKTDPDRDFVRQNIQAGPNSNNERKLVLIGVINSILGIVSELTMWVVFFVSLAAYKNSSCLTFSWCLFIMNNVLNFPVYLIIFHCKCISK